MRYLILLLPMALAACATTGSSNGMVAVETVAQGQALPGAQCTVSTATSSWNITTPTSVAVGSTSGDLRVVCNKEGYRTSELLFRPSSPFGSFVDLGVASSGSSSAAGVGLSFPISFGGGSYPAHVTVNLNPQ
jgi:hypothetical protein